MTENDLISEGLNLMLLGMGFVFVFLTLLVVATALMSRVITFYEKRVGLLPEEGIPAPTAVLGNPVNNTTTKDKDANLISVLSAAVHRFRQKNK
ncbi:Oxaloacetate decarboxylase gamma chain [Methylophaga frappieri]|uniref:Probable oxaloacetate decarboxylase gamma chain n=1 Tax=Methylophaga frappieri (strain ATCC BAA-2434 / DSM 25690 / JAM7) TaxID=754477 RepID=I1YER7_METFJ|nr:OadG family transporter subunit [Methylophaga frappieri]AFJ01410.1 Oxaloacetate decarboxylase gamma chain [Methylophaga frappieri]